MPRKKTRRYRDYSEIIDGKLYAVVNLRQPDGKYKKKRKQVESKTAALQWALEELEKHKKGSKYDDSWGFGDFADWYVEEFLHEPIYENGLKVSGVKDYERLKNKVEKMKDFFGEKKMSEFDENDLRRWAKFRRTEEVLTATLNRDFALLRTMFRRAVMLKKLLTIPKFEINLAAEIERDRVMTPDEERRLLAACVAEETLSITKKNGRKYEMTIDAKREHLKPIIILAVDSALRLNELFTLTWGDVDFDNNIISVKAQNAKRQVSRKTIITPRAKEELLKMERGSDKALVFGQKSPVKAFNTACRRAKIKDLHFHDLRHTAITRMIRAGIPHTEVMKLSGHKTMKTFMRYLNIQPDALQNAAEKLAAFLEKQSPIGL